MSYTPLDNGYRFISHLSPANGSSGPVGMGSPTLHENFIYSGGTFASVSPFNYMEALPDLVPDDGEEEVEFDSLSNQGISRGHSNEDRGPSLRVTDIRLPLRYLLGLRKRNILHFEAPSRTLSKHSMRSPKACLPLDLELQAESQLSNYNSWNSGPSAKKTKVERLVPFRVLDAPGLRNDFYSNLISWSVKTNSVAVGLNKEVYIWNKEAGVTLVNIDNSAIITSVAFSSGDHLLIGTNSGQVWLVSQSQNKVIGNITREGTSICTILWSASGKSFFLGDSLGVVGCFDLQHDRRGDRSGEKCPIFKLRSSLIFHRQQICGMALNQEENEIAIGGNDNYCTIWDISDIDRPRLKHPLKHKAAVKAISYCPWSKSLLATGGGTKDRSLRIWHTGTGTMLKEFNTKYQITSLIWSTYLKEIVLTFGFGDGNARLLIAGYTYPGMKTKYEVSSPANLRVLSAVISPDKESICVSANDETVRFYKFWDSSRKSHLTSSPEAQGIGMYGSPLIELLEGVDKRGESIR